MEYLTISEVSEMLGISNDAIRILETQGILMPIRTVGGHRRYDKNQIINFNPGGSMIDTNNYLRQIFNSETSHLCNLEKWEQYYNSVVSVYPKGAIPYIGYTTSNELPKPEIKFKDNFYLFGPHYFVVASFPTLSDWKKHQHEIVFYKAIQSIIFNADGFPRSKTSSIMIETNSKTHTLQAEMSSNCDQLLKIYEFLLGKL